MHQATFKMRIKIRPACENLFVPVNLAAGHQTYCNCYKFLHKFALWQAGIAPPKSSGTVFHPRWSCVLCRPLAFLIFFDTFSLVLWVFAFVCFETPSLAFTLPCSALLTTFWAIFKPEIHFQLFGVPPWAFRRFTYCAASSCAVCWSVNILAVGVNRIL